MRRTITITISDGVAEAFEADQASKAAQALPDTDAGKAQATQRAKLLETAAKAAGANRDKGRAYRLTEMPASQGEWFAFRAFVALAQGGVELPDNFRSMGMAGLAMLTLQQFGKINPNDARPLLDELYQQISVVSDPKSGFTRPLIEDDIDEISTHFKLKWELIKLHAGFSETAS